MRIVWTKEIRNSKFELFSTSVFWLELEGRQKERKVGEEKRREEKTILYLVEIYIYILINLNLG